MPADAPCWRRQTRLPLRLMRPQPSGGRTVHIWAQSCCPMKLHRHCSRRSTQLQAAGGVELNGLGRRRFCHGKHHKYNCLCTHHAFESLAFSRTMANSVGPPVSTSRGFAAFMLILRGHAHKGQSLKIEHNYAYQGCWVRQMRPVVCGPAVAIVRAACGAMASPPAQVDPCSRRLARLSKGAAFSMTCQKGGSSA